jgi:ABC-type multidrug transport system permease subunit
MRANVILQLLKNDLKQFSRNKQYLLSGVLGNATVLFLLLLIVVFPIQAMNDLHATLIDSIRIRYPGIDEATLVRIAISETIIPGLLMLGVAISPGFLALSAVTGEKEQKTLECFLLLPVSDREILVSKTLSSISISLLGTWAAYLIGAIFSVFYHRDAYASYLFNPKLLAEMILLLPSIAILSALGGIIVSINTADTKTAQSLAFIPQTVLMLLCVLLIMGTLSLSQKFLLIAVVTVNCLNLIGLGIAITCFKREHMLLRY